MSSVAISLARSDSDIAAVRALFRRYAEALPFSLAYQGFDDELAGLPFPYAEPGGRLRVAKTGEEYLGIVGIKRLDASTAEIKRLYVVPEARRGGLGRLLLERAMTDAAELGYRRVRLDSHRPSMAAAIALYRRLGFVEIPPYGPDLDGTIAFFEKHL